MIARFAALVVLAFTLVGCGTTQPLYNADAVSFNASLTAEQAEQAITRGVEYKRWSVVSKTPGEVVAEIFVRTHYAKVRIPYSAQGFSIIYVDSKELDYEQDKKGEEIHRNYNKWILLLEQEIQNEANRL